MAEREPFESKLDGLQVALTYDDVLLLPGFSDVLPHEVDISTRLGPKETGIQMASPLLAAAMDTVCDGRFAATAAGLGWLGIIHKNFSPEERRAEIAWLKKQQSGVVYDPITLEPHRQLREAKYIVKQKGISGIPIIDEDGKVAGIVTNRDVEDCFDDELELPVETRMTPRDKLVHLEYKEHKKPEEYATEAAELMKRHRIEKMPIIRSDNTLEGLITKADIRKLRRNPRACRDPEGRLRVGVAVGVTKDELEGVPLLLDAGADVICVDTAHGHSKGVLDACRYISGLKKSEEFRERPFVVIAGNVATFDGAMALIEAGADAIKVGIGPGGICTTRVVSGVGVPQAWAIEQAARAIYESGRDVSLIADGGIKFSGDVTKALAARADCVMIGGLFAGVREAPGDIIMYQGRQWKTYRGMGSIGAMRKKGGRDRYFQGEVEEASKLVPEGIEGRVPFKGYLADNSYQLEGGLRSGMGYVGAEDIPSLQKKAKFVRVSPATAKESHPHGVMITEEAPNYSQR